ncbi:hypothetical protein [Rossellomorea sp. KS-H15a]|uniref:hypothetical protein n=1 Tax=Rossellomorea sp. KS-H15a TaxID=2963940 RepID=UPI0020C685E7|nr:hypothetical protein [Rossellomorea sp. KS-H15a]UTE78698.1 hypothetical protein M1J35_08080 [Rossellomorea sp. KS-H15a]
MMNKPLESIFFLSVWIGKWIGKRIGREVKGLISFVLIYFIFKLLLSILTDMIGSPFIDQLFYFFNTYLLLGMFYVYAYDWKSSKK